MKGRIPIPEPQEPAHPPIFELQDILRELYTILRDKYQDQINQAFDEVSRDIGFVIATTLPATFHVSERGIVESLSVPDASPLKGTLLDRTVTGAIKGALNDQHSIGKSGDYTVYLIWQPALQFKLRRDWMEPAHWYGPWTEPAHPGRRWLDLVRLTAPERVKELAWDVREPVHWFTPGAELSALEALHVSLLDEVYPDLRLMDRVVAARRGARAVLPEVQEPAHFRDLLSSVIQLSPELLTELAQVLRRYGY
jgi:hypothetical protein